MPIEAVTEPVEAAGTLTEPSPPAEELQKQRESEEAADFITRHVLERGATLFDG